MSEKERGTVTSAATAVVGGRILEVSSTVVMAESGTNFAGIVCLNEHENLLSG